MAMRTSLSVVQMDPPGSLLEMLDEDYCLIRVGAHDWIVDVHSGHFHVSRLPGGSSTARSWMEASDLDQDELVRNRRGLTQTRGLYMPASLFLPFIWSCYRLLYQSAYGALQVQGVTEQLHRRRHARRRSEEGRADRLIVVRHTDRVTQEFYQYCVYYATEQSSKDLIFRIRTMHPVAVTMWTILHPDPHLYWETCVRVLDQSIQTDGSGFDLCPGYSQEQLQLDMVQMATATQN